MSPFPIFTILFLAFSILVISLTKKKISYWIGKRKPSFTDWKPILFITLQLLIVGMGVDLIAAYFHVNDTQGVGEAVAQLASAPFLSVILLGFGSLAEEVFFRGILLVAGGPFLSSFFFAIFHWGYDSLIQLVGSFLAGLILCRARQQYGGIFPLVVSHFLYNVIIVFWGR
jgi:membrane protease YdiL (CAAX protease family)